MKQWSQEQLWLFEGELVLSTLDQSYVFSLISKNLLY